MSSAPIGIYDSGIGGLTVWRAIRDRLPRESIIYLGDGENCPYGSKSCEQILTFADRAMRELIDKGCKLIVVACNTATAAAIEILRERYPEIEIVGMEPAIKPACKLTKSGVVGVLATERSLEGGLFQRTAARYSTGVRVIARFGRGFVELVEGGEESSPEAERVVRAVVDEMLAEGVDQIVLGCTHYPLLIPILQRIAPNVNIIDPAPAVARRVEELLHNEALLCDEGEPSYHFLTFANEEYRQILSHRAESM